MFTLLILRFLGSQAGGKKKESQLETDLVNTAAHSQPEKVDEAVDRYATTLEDTCCGSPE